MNSIKWIFFAVCAQAFTVNSTSSPVNVSWPGKLTRSPSLPNICNGSAVWGLYVVQHVSCNLGEKTHPVRVLFTSFPLEDMAAIHGSSVFNLNITTLQYDCQKRFFYISLTSEYSNVIHPIKYMRERLVVDATWSSDLKEI